MTVGSDAHGRLAVVPDPRGTAPGRGAHLHPTVACYELAVRRKAFGRALRWSGPGGLDSAAVADHISGAATEHDQQDKTLTDQREEGWSSSS